MADTARTVASDPRAPSDERFDANAELAKSVHSPADIIPADQIAPVIAMVKEELERGEMLRKTQVLPYAGRERMPAPRGMQSLALDGWQVNATGGYYERPAAMSFDSLRMMVAETPILSAVVMQRIRQINRFTGLSDDGGPGFEICHMDKKHKRTPDEEQACRDLGRFFLNSGWEWRPRERRRLKRENFQRFMAKSVRDSLTMDSAPIETEMKRDRARGLDGFYAVDGATIRLCGEMGFEGDPDIYAAQLVQGSLASTYELDDLIYEPRNPQSDVRFGGYGLGETELLIRTVTGFLNAMSYNIAGFDRNQIPKGLLHLQGDYEATDLASFRRNWNGMVSGVNNAWALPVMVSKAGAESKASFENFGVEHSEMHFAKWMSFLTSIICAVYGMSPDEINFESFASSKSSLSGSDTVEKLADSKDKGLRPLMSYYENLFTDFMVHDIAPNLAFRWVGLEPVDQERERDEIKLTNTVDELRARRGDEPHPDPKIGGAPLNPALMQVYMQSITPQQAPDFGTEGEGDDQGGGDFGGGGGGGDFGKPGAGGDEEQDPAQRGAPTGAPPGQPSAPPAGGTDFGKALPTIYAMEP